MKNIRYWTPEEEQILRDRYPQDGAVILIPILNRSRHSITRKAYEMGLKANAVTTSEAEQLAHLHIRTRERDRIASLSPRDQKEIREGSRLCGIERRKKRRENRLCIRCGKPAIEHNAQHCLLHWAHMIAGSTCGMYSEVYAQSLLGKLEQQDYRCAMTGELLIPGLNASLDHIIPKSKGGSASDLDNLQWVTDSVNFAKRQFLPSEFVEFCRKVVDFHDMGVSMTKIVERMIIVGDPNK